MRYGTTTHQLLTHTAGFDERFAGAYTDAGHVVPLAEHLRLSPPQQVIRPGRAYSYSNYNYAVAGLVIEARSGLTFERYLDERVFGPLKMTASTAHQPPQSRLAANLSRGYRWTGDRHQPLEYRYTYASPSGAIATSAADIGRFMIALLGDGVLDGTRVLSPASAKALLAAQFTPDPRIPATTYGFSHLMWHGRRLVIRGGTLGDQAGMLILMPEDRLGIFVASNSLPGLGDFLYAPMMTHLFGDADPPLPHVGAAAGARERAARLAGTYRDYHHTRSDMSRMRALMPMIQARLTVDGDGALRWRGRRWLEVEPSVFRREDAHEYIVFRDGERGEARRTSQQQRHLRAHRLAGANRLSRCLTHCVHGGLRGVRRVPAGGTAPAPARRRLTGGWHGRLAAFVATTNLLFLLAAGAVAAGNWAPSRRCPGRRC